MSACAPLTCPTPSKTEPSGAPENPSTPCPSSTPNDSHFPSKRQAKAFLLSSLLFSSALPFAIALFFFFFFSLLSFLDFQYITITVYDKLTRLIYGYGFWTLGVFIRCSCGGAKQSLVRIVQLQGRFHFGLDYI